MASLDLNSLKYRATSPELVSLNAVRHIAVENTSGGIFNITNAITFHSNDDGQDAAAEINIRAEGRSPDGERLYFHVDVKLQSQLLFESGKDDAINSAEFADHLSQLMFNKMTACLEVLVWQMGYKGLTLDLSLTDTNKMLPVKVE